MKLNFIYLRHLICNLVFLTFFFNKAKKPDRVKEYFKKFQDNPTAFQPEKEYRTIFITPNIVAGALNVFFDILFIILLVIMWKKKLVKVKLISN